MYIYIYTCVCIYTMYITGTRKQKVVFRDEKCNKRQRMMNDSRHNAQYEVCSLGR